MTKNNENNYESVFIAIDRHKHPIAWSNRVLDLTENYGFSQEDAELEASKPIEMELYYDSALFMVESEAVVCTSIYNPYTAEKLEENENK